MLLSEMTSVFLSAFTYLALIAVLGNIGGNALIYLSDKKYPDTRTIPHLQHSSTHRLTHPHHTNRRRLAQ